MKTLDANQRPMALRSRIMDVTIRGPQGGGKTTFALAMTRLLEEAGYVVVRRDLDSTADHESIPYGTLDLVVINEETI